MTQKKTVNNNIYGRFSYGSGSILRDKDKIWAKIDDPEVIADYQRRIEYDLLKSGISLNKIKLFNVMDVGTGRQAIAFWKMGARSIHHYDLSMINVERLRVFISNKNLSKQLKTNCCDLVEYKMPEEKYDLVYLNGVVQHFSDVSKGLLNCSKAVKMGGYLWLYFYRSGTFDNFVIYMIRDLIKHYKKSVDYWIASNILFSEDALPSFYVSNIMDNFFVDYIQLYTPDKYLDFIKQAGFEIVSSSKLDPLGRKVDHEFAANASVITLLKTAKTINENVDMSILSPDNSVCQLSRNLYKEMYILRTIDLYNELKERIEEVMACEAIIMSIAFRINQFLVNLDKRLKAEEKHKLLQSLFSNISALIRKESWQK